MSKLGVYIAAAARDVPNNFPAVLFRELGSPNFVEVHRSSVPSDGVNGSGFSAVHGTADAEFVVAVGQKMFKAAAIPIIGCMSYYDGTWHEVSIPANYEFVDCWVPEAGVAYVGGYISTSANTARLWRWTPTGGFVEVYQYVLPGTPACFHHFSGSSKNNIWVGLSYAGNSTSSTTWVVHWNGSLWLPYNLSPVPPPLYYGPLPAIASDTKGWINTLGGQGSAVVTDLLEQFFTGGSIPNWSSVATLPAGSVKVAYACAGTEDYALLGMADGGIGHVYRFTSAGGIVSVATSWRISRIAIAADGLRAIALSNNTAITAFYRESADAGVTWTPQTVISGYEWVAGLFFAEGIPEEPAPTPTPNPRSTSNSKIYPFVIQSIRDADEADGDLLLKRWTEGMDVQWGAIDRKIRELATLIDPETCPSEAVAFLGWIVGLTKELEGLTGGISESDYRQLIAIAVRMWKKKGSGLGLVETLASISGYDVRYLTWFFFRIILGEFELGRAEFDVDPWLLDQPGMSPGVPPDALVVERILRGTVLPSAADPIWTYVNEGAIEGATFSISGGKISETQASAAGGRYRRDDVAGLFDPEAAEVGAIFRIDAKVSVGGTPWFLELEDGVRGYRLRISDGVAVLQDAAGNAIESRSRGFSVGVDYALRIARTGPTTVDVTIDGASVFGEREISEFAASANKRYGFGYRSEADPSNDWTVSWREVGPRPVLKFDLSTLLGLTEAVPHDVRVVYRENAGRTSPSFWTGSRNEVSISDAFGVSIPLDLELANFRVGVDPDEFVSDLRVVDDGTLDRVFVANLVGVLRPSGERVFVRFVDFQDLFQNRDLRYWTLESGTATPRPDDGRLDLEDGAVATVVHADMPLASVWRQFTAAAQYSLRDEVAGKWGELRFHVQDDLNFYAVRFDPGVRTVALQKVVAGARSTIFTHGPMPVFYPGVLYMTHVTTEDVVGGVLIKVYLDGNYLGESIEADFDEGTLGLAVELGQRLSVSFADLVVCPFSSARVGPGIDASPTWSDDCANP